MDLYDLYTEKAAKIGVPEDRKFVWIRERSQPFSPPLMYSHSNLFASRDVLSRFFFFTLLLEDKR